mgnify:CR=1 FL=1
MQHEKHKSARRTIKEIDRNPTNYLIIHYSCESFYDITDGHTPRITSIAVYDYASAQTDSFSIHKMAERKMIPIDKIEDHYDELEKSMLNEFFAYVKDHRNYTWIHWNMRDINYGFKAIEHRFSVLGGKPCKIPDIKKVDLARLLIDCYGVNYVGHPRMEKLIELNKISAKDYLSGQQEADSFKNKEYVKLHRSTLRKVDVFANILNRVIDNKLKVNSKWHEIYGLSFQGIFSFCQEKWWMQIIITMINLIIGAFLGVMLGKII